MRWYLLRRLGISLLTLWIATIVVFIGVRLLPGSPADALSAELTSPEARQAIEEKYHLDDSIPVQYGYWVSHAVRGDFGQSPLTGLSVSDTVGNALPITLELALFAVLFAMLIGVPAGVIAAARPGKFTDYVASGVALAGLSIPSFWFGILLILLFAVNLGWMPAAGFVPILEDPVSNLQHMVMPALVLGLALAAVVMRQTRSAMLESLGADYVRTARAKGVSEWSVVTSHALRNSLITVVTVFGIQLGQLIVGVVATEQVFDIQGVGRLTLQSVLQRDYPTLQAVVLVTTGAYILVNLLVDLTYSLINPRIRVAGAVA